MKGDGLHVKKDEDALGRHMVLRTSGEDDAGWMKGVGSGRSMKML